MRSSMRFFDPAGCVRAGFLRRALAMNSISVVRMAAMGAKGIPGSQFFMALLLNNGFHGFEGDAQADYGRSRAC
ncbi:MAG: hypothetical protein P4M08_13450 [Oligoflexia bacterium]|nr:hypothetical protein [Oligoflexia bacterium]